MTATASPLRAFAGRRPSRHSSRVAALRVAVVLGIGLLWELVSRFEVLDPREFPPFTKVVAAFASTLGEAATWAAISDTLAGWALGMLVSIVVGVGLALVIGASPFLVRSTSVVIDVLRSTPAPAIIFVLILLFGSGLTMKVMLIFFAAVFPILIQSMYGVRSVDPVLRDLAKSYRLTRLDTFLRVRLPAALPYVATGVRISASLALIVAVVAEFLGGAPGLGKLVEDVRAVGDFPAMYALILLVGGMSAGLNQLMALVERRLLHWHPSQRRNA